LGRHENCGGEPEEERVFTMAQLEIDLAFSGWPLWREK